jgi:hypothetical protein
MLKIFRPLQLSFIHRVLKQNRKFYFTASASLGINLQTGEALLEFEYMVNALFNSADLTGSDFSGVDTRQTQFRKARLAGANLAGINLMEGSGQGRYRQRVVCGRQSLRRRHAAGRHREYGFQGQQPRRHRYGELEIL